MRVLITGANGFVGKNLQLHLAERSDVEVLCFTREHTQTDLLQLVADADLVFHLAGVNRPQDPSEFQQGNADLTQALCNALAQADKAILATPTCRAFVAAPALSTQRLTQSPSNHCKYV